MRTIKVGNAVFPVMYAGTSPFSDKLKTQLYYGEMNLVQVAEILNGNTGIEYADDDQVETFEGFSRLESIGYVDGETIVAFLGKEENNGAIS